MTILIMIIGFILLIKGAEIFIDGATSIAYHLKLPKVLVGLVIIAFGTSSPEMAISMQALINNNGDLIFFNVVGSNIVNSLLILGLACIVCPPKIKVNVVNKEIPLALLITILFALLVSDNLINKNLVNMLTRIDSLIIVILFFVFMNYLWKISTKKKVELEIPKYHWLKSILLTFLGIIALIYGSDFVVNNAITLANKAGLSEKLIAILIIVPGTSLPELVTTLTAAVKKEQDILVGSIIGSNIFNICMVLCFPVLLHGGIPITASSVDLFVLVISAVILYVFAKSNHKITKSEGAMMVMVYVFYITYVIISGIM